MVPTAKTTVLDDFLEFSEALRIAGEATRTALFEDLVAAAKARLANPGPSDFAWFNNLIELLVANDFEFDHEAQAMALLSASQSLNVGGQARIAARAAGRAAEIAGRAKLDALRRRALNVLGFINIHYANFAGAYESLDQALHLARMLHDASAEASVWSNIAAAQVGVALYDDAILTCRHVLKLAEARNDNALRFQAYTNMATCCLRLSRIEPGLQAADSAIAVAPVPATSTEIVMRLALEHTYIWLLLLSGQMDKAHERVEFAESLARQTRSQRAELQANIARALYDAYRPDGDALAAGRRLAQELARIPKNSPTYLDALIALDIIFRRARRPDEALNYLNLHLEHLRTLHRENTDKQVSESAMPQPRPPQKEFMRLEMNAASLREQVARGREWPAQRETLEWMAVVAEFRDDTTGEHAYRVGRLAALVAREHGCDEEAVEGIELAARLHDIGKIGIPDAVLLKPTWLTEAETTVVRQHTDIGAEILGAHASIHPVVRQAVEVARHHHEWWNGDGYPDGLEGADIPYAARLTAIADVFDALVHARPYKDEWDFSESLSYMRALSGEQFDPELLELFLTLVERLKAEHGPGLDAFLAEGAASSKLLSSRKNISIALADTLSAGRMHEVANRLRAAYEQEEATRETG